MSDTELNEAKHSKNPAEPGSEDRLTSDSSRDSSSSASDESSGESSNESDSQSNTSGAESATSEPPEALQPSNLQENMSKVDTSGVDKDSTLNLSNESFQSADLTLTRNLETELTDQLSPTRNDSGTVGTKNISPAGSPKAPSTSEGIELKLMPNNQHKPSDLTNETIAAQPPVPMEAPKTQSVPTPTPAITMGTIQSSTIVKKAQTGVVVGKINLMEAAPSSSSKVEVNVDNLVQKGEARVKDKKPDKKNKKSDKERVKVDKVKDKEKVKVSRKGTSRSPDGTDRKDLEDSLLARMLAKFMAQGESSKGTPRRKERKRKPSKHGKHAKSKKSRKAESSSGSDSSSSESSVEVQPPASSSSRIARISNDRKYLQQAMDRAMAVGISKDDDTRHRQLTEAIRETEDTAFDIHPSMAYKHFDNVIGTTLPHVQSHVHTYRDMFGPLTKATTKMHLSLAREQIRTRRTMIGGPEPTNPFAPVWAFNNDLQHTEASSVAAMKSARTPSTTRKVQSASAASVANNSSVNFDQLDLDPGPSTSGSTLKRKLQPGNSSTADAISAASLEPIRSKDKSRDSKKDRSVKKVKKHSKDRGSENLLTSEVVWPMGFFKSSSHQVDPQDTQPEPDDIATSTITFPQI